MKIERRKSSPTSGPSQTSRATPSKRPGQARDEKVEGAPQAEPAVGVSLSDTSQVLSSAQEALAALPDVRVERVNEIRTSVDDGSYRVESHRVAKRMVDESLRESAMKKRGK